MLQWGRGLSTAEMWLVATSSQQVPSWLQWGRGLSTAEMGVYMCHTDLSKQLQWGRGLSTAEMKVSGSSKTSRIVLQWGRGLSTAEIVAYDDDLKATVALQWGRGLSTAEMSLRPITEKATHELQWGRGLSTAEMRFVWEPKDPQRRASMGPRSFNRGNPEEGWRSGANMGCFNGAAVFQPRKSRKKAEVEAEKQRLQWGRGLSTAEICRVDIPTRLQERLQWGRGLSTAEMMDFFCKDGIMAKASMGPRSFNRGNVKYFRRYSRHSNGLQWGRGLSTAEMTAR